MNTKLNHIQDWPQLAKQAGWSAKGMAKLCGVSVRSLERHFIEKMGKSPKAWMKECRQKKAGKLIQGGSSVKETGVELGYKHSTHFSQDFKKHWGCCPTQYHSGSQNAGTCRVSV
jgi:transcriptional regulator GlxA family with amidase domain